MVFAEVFLKSGKCVVEPSEGEGFKEVKKIFFLPEFADDRAKKLFLQRT